MVDLAGLKVYVNGRFVPAEEASISVFDRGLLYGDAVFEGIREYDGKVFKLDEHVDRLYASAHILRLEIPVSRAQMKDIILETLRVNGLRDAHMRPIVTRGTGALGLDPSGAKPSIIVFAHPWPPFLGGKGVRLKTASWRRIPPECLDSKVKCVGAYVNSVLAEMEAKAAGYDEALLLDTLGFVAEGPGENVLLVKNGELLSPHVTNVLDGITRRTVLALAGEMGIPVRETNLTLGDVYTADEAMMCGTAVEIAAIAEVDDRRIGVKAPGEITSRLQDKFRDLVKREGTSVDIRG
ncbi:MAG: branched-chain-amino-acid transaminase [Ignavibacteriales bacterium]